MILSRRVALNGNQLDQVDSRIVIRSVDLGEPQENVTAADLCGGYGQRITSQHWQMLEVTVAWAMDIPKKQLSARKEVFDKVNKWALQKGWLTVNYITGRRMRVDKVIVPGSGDLWEWTNEFKITFRAYGVPFWQDSTATTETIAAADENSGTITVPGMIDTVCDAEITNASGSTINTMTVTVGSSSFEFSGLGLADEERLVIGHGDDGVLYIRKYTGSSYFVRVMDKRTGGSSDDLYVSPGDNAITITGGDVTATVSCYGRYL